MRNLMTHVVVFSPTMMDMDDCAQPGQLTQRFFWGGHGGVGGGDGRQLESSSCTIRFLVEEMQRREIPLLFKMDKIPEYGDVESPVPEVHSSRVMAFVEKITGKYVRPIPSVESLHPLAIRRYQKVPEWRPASLEHLHDEIMAYPLEEKE